ncbi:MAG: S8 family serine peptidase [Phycisphaerae bacterium]
MSTTSENRRRGFSTTSASGAGSVGTASTSHVLLDLGGVATSEDRARLARAGLTLLGYAGGGRYFAVVPDGYDTADARGVGIQSVVPLTTPMKLHPAFQNGGTPAVAIVGGVESDQIEVAAYVLFHEDVACESLGSALLAAHGGLVRSILHTINGLVVELPRAELESLAAADGVLWVEPPLPRMSGTNDLNRTVTQVEAVQTLPDFGLSGTGVRVMLYDVGGALEDHPDFGTRVRIRDGSSSAVHSTHVAGTIAGDGFASSGLWRGMAPGAEIESYAFAPEGASGAIFLYNDPGDLEADYTDAFGVFGAAVANNSIGSNICINGFDCALTGAYGVTSRLIDALVAGSIGQTVRIVWAAGNERSCDRCGGAGTRRADGYGSIPPPSGGKNSLCVGAVNADTGQVSAFSSWGPTADGRLKPDIVAPGCQLGGDFGVTSTTLLGSYTTLCGTSMATPTVTGISALLLEEFETRFPGRPAPSNALLKAMLSHTALDVEQVGPDYRSGYGLVQAQAAVEFLRTGDFLMDTVDHDETTALVVRVLPGTAQLKLTLAWDDAPALPLASRALMNDLDLRVIGPDGSRFFPWTLDPDQPDLPATASQPDRTNNVEQVFVGAPGAGLWFVQIHGAEVPVGPQAFALCFSTGVTSDCDNDGVDDADQIAADPALDCGGNGVLDVCEPDCDSDGVADSCALASGARDCDRNLRPDACDPLQDCNGNGVLDACDVADGVEADCDENLIPDSCQPDCDADGLADACALLAGEAEDCGGNGIPDQCEALLDCNLNGTDDGCDIRDGDSLDRNANGIPDECEPTDRFWYVDAATCPDFGDGSESTPFCAIQDAIDVSLDGHTVIIAPGVYTGARNRNLDFDGRLIHIRSVDPEDDAVVEATTIDCESQGRAFYLHRGENATAIIEGLTIRRGLSASGATPDPLRGGAIYCKDSHPTIRRCRITENMIAPTIFSSLGGAGIYCERSSPIIERCTITGNTTTSFGGGVYCFDDAHPTIRDCVIADNVAFGGGGVAVGLNSSPLIQRCVISDNLSLQGGAGGGLNIFTLASPIIDTCLIVRNSTGGDGGAVFTSSTSNPLFTNTTIAQNQAAHLGGAVRMAFSSAPTFRGCILWDNNTEDGSAEVLVDTNSSFLVEYSLVQGGLAGIATGANGTVHFGAGNVEADPLFEASAVGSFAISAGSPAVNAGDPHAVIPDDALDLAGALRVQQCRVDMGALESGFLTDCNANGASDACEIADGVAEDCDAGGTPDVCQDTSADCNANGVWDACDIADGADEDCNANLIPDACELGVEGALDCNVNGVLDECDIADGTSEDVNDNATPDECETCKFDSDCSDGLFCTGAEICTSGVCLAGPPPCPGQVCRESDQSCVACLIDADCDDANPCTFEWCNHTTCESSLVEGPCNDGLPCTTNDVCVDGFCHGSIIGGCAVTYSIRAVAVDGIPLPGGPSDQIMLYNASTVTLELFLEGWDPEVVRLYNLAVSGDGYTSGARGTLFPLTDPNPSAGAFIDQSREDFIFFDLDTIVAVFNGDPALYQWGGLVFFGEDCVEDNGQSPYLGTLILTASEDAAGLFTICPDATDANHDASPDNSFVTRCNADPIVPVDLQCVSILVIADCNDNGISDDEDIASGTSEDCTGNGFPDECEADCNNNGRADSCDIADGVASDCNANAIPDSCDIATAQSGDCNVNGIPDECESDCNQNGVADSCDIASGTSEDCDGLGVPDECEDCNANGVGDLCDLAAGDETDCNDNLVLDSCDLVAGTSQDCDADAVPDECEDTSLDCNNNDVWDACDIMVGDGFDCNANGMLDECDLADGVSTDCDENRLPDECPDFFPRVIDPTRLAGVRGFPVLGFHDDARTGGNLSSVGDFNHDGFDDFVVGADNAAVASQESAGEAYVVFGHFSPWPETLDLGQSPSGSPGQVLTIQGRSIGDSLGVGLGGGGDFNGDAVDDLLVGAWGANPNEVLDAGEVYLFFGREDTDQLGTMSPDDLDGTNGLTLRGAAEGDLTGLSVAFAGDVNGDALDDLIISAHTANVGERTFAGRIYVVFGSTLPQSTAFELASLLPEHGGDGSLGFVLNGVNASDLAGFSVAGAGDVNGDGLGDMLIGSFAAGPNELAFAGQTYLIFGRPDIGQGGVLELADLDGQNGVTFNGVDLLDLSGHHVAGAGDVNGDGFDDLLNGAVWADPGGRATAGETYLVFGHADPWPAVVELATLLPENGGDGSAGVTFNGIDAGDFSGFHCGSAGDVNADGLDDIAIGAYGVELEDVPQTGEVYIVFGRAASWPAVVELADLLEVVDPPDRIGFVVRGQQENGRLGFAVGTLGDINGDGAAEVGLGAPGILRDDIPDVGAMFLTFGRHIEPRDCNGNGTLDQCDIIDRFSTDCNENNVPDECEGAHPDCNANGVWDLCDLMQDGAPDCNANGVPDKCDILDGASIDCNTNEVPDECEDDDPSDCNENGVWDVCDLLSGASDDCNTNQVPDECEPGGLSDCNGNGAFDLCDIESGFSLDLNANAVPDDCEPHETIHVDTSDCDPVSGGTGTPDDPFCRIQDAIDSAPVGDDRVIDIVVADGTYTGNGNRNIVFNNGLESGTRAVRVHSANGPGDCLIDCGGVLSAFLLTHGETRGTRIEGFTIIGARKGAFKCENGSNPVIEDCTITRNFRISGGAGIRCVASSPLIRRCRIAGNTTNAIQCRQGSNPLIQDCLIVGNEALNGPAIHALDDSHPTLLGCTIARNDASLGAGVLAEPGSSFDFRDSIIYANVPTDVMGLGAIRFTDIGGGHVGVGNIDEDPQFRFFETGFWTADPLPTPRSGQYILTDATAQWIPSALAGAFVNTNLDGQVSLEFPIVANTETTVTIWGEGWGLAHAGTEYAIVDYRLLATSPGINNADLAVQPTGVPRFDVAGEPRVQHCRMDMGAFESPFAVDCDANGLTDACEALSGSLADCNENAVPDGCEPDCDLNGVPDPCEVLFGRVRDVNGNGIPDLCEIDLCDLNGDRHVDGTDRQIMGDCVRQPPGDDILCPNVDLNADGALNGKDIETFLECFNVFADPRDPPDPPGSLGGRATP